SRPVGRLLARAEVWSAVPRGVWSRRPYEVTRSFRTRLHVAAADDPAWLAGWREADRVTGRRLDRLLAGEPLTGPAVAGAVARALGPGEQLVVGASNPVRDLDLMVPRYPVGEHRKVLANRGLAGIDGVVS